MIHSRTFGSSDLVDQGPADGFEPKVREFLPPEDEEASGSLSGSQGSGQQRVGPWQRRRERITGLLDIPLIPAREVAVRMDCEICCGSTDHPSVLRFGD